jgi:hypothetical protein
MRLETVEGYNRHVLYPSHRLAKIFILRCNAITKINFLEACSN